MGHSPFPDDLARLEAAFEDGRLSGLDGSALDCPFGHDAALLRTAWHAGFTRGRLQDRTLPPPRARSRKDP